MNIQKVMFVELFVFVESPWVVRGYRYGNGVGGGMAVCGVGKYFLIRICRLISSQSEKRMNFVLSATCA